MRILLSVLLVVLMALTGVPVRAADLPYDPSIEVPPVDYGLQGGFYLRGSGALNVLWTQEHRGTCGCIEPATGGRLWLLARRWFRVRDRTGLRFDGTVDYLSNDGLTDGTNTLHLRSAVGLANAYYDIPLSGGGAAGGGFGAYVGAGVGAAWYHVNTTPANALLPDGSGWTPAAAAMAGVTYDAAAGSPISAIA